MSIANRPPMQQSIAVIHAAIDAGMTLIDTADVYCVDHTDIGHNERLIAQALKERPSDKVLVATKGGLERPNGAWTTNGHPAHLQAACEASLKALEIEAIDLYQLHAPDDDIPFADSVGALAELQRAGKIRHIGLSNVDVSEIETARSIAPVVSVQNRCNPMDTTSFGNGVVDYCTKHRIAFLPHSPVGGHQGHMRLQDNPILARISQRRDCSPYQLCLAMLLARSPVMIPIPGASKIASAQSSAQAASLDLTEQDLSELKAGFPDAYR